MLKRTAIAVALIAIGVTQPIAEESAQLRKSANADAEPSAPVASLATLAASEELEGRGPTQALLQEIGAWLSQNFDLPQAGDLPTVRQVSAAELMALRLDALTGAQRLQVAVAQRAGSLIRREPVALYNSRTKTIFLADDWTGSRAADVSVLVHEMVHHLQNLAGHKHLCPQERERLAYQAQEKWLALAGRSLATEFELDPFTVLVSTLCSH